MVGTALFCWTGFERWEKNSRIMFDSGWNKRKDCKYQKNRANSTNMQENMQRKIIKKKKMCESCGRLQAIMQN